MLYAQKLTPKKTQSPKIKKGGIAPPYLLFILTLTVIYKCQIRNDLYFQWLEFPNQVQHW